MFIKSALLIHTFVLAADSVVCVGSGNLLAVDGLGGEVQLSFRAGR